MEDSFRIGEQQGEAAFSVYGLSPLLFPQRGIRNWKYLPLNRDLPQDGLQFTVLKFMWGFNGNFLGFESLGTKNIVLQIKKPTWIWALGGVSNDNTGPAGSNQGFYVQFYQTHNGKQSAFFNRPVLNTEILGQAVSAGSPRMMVQPHLLLPGDSIECEVKNLGTPTGTNRTSISVALFGGEYEGSL